MNELNQDTNYTENIQIRNYKNMFKFFLKFYLKEWMTEKLNKKQWYHKIFLIMIYHIFTQKKQTHSKILFFFINIYFLYYILILFVILIECIFSDLIIIKIMTWWYQQEMIYKFELRKKMKSLWMKKKSNEKKRKLN